MILNLREGDYVELLSEDIEYICLQYNLECISIGEVIDTSKSIQDLRYNYEINEKYFLKISCNKGMSEYKLNCIDNMISNYCSIGVYCPSLIKRPNGKFMFEYEFDSMLYSCYMEEKAVYQTGHIIGDIDYSIKRDIVEHLGVLASKFSGVNLSKSNSMWSIVSLSDYDDEIDEKQENFNSLIECLSNHGYIELGNQLTLMNNVSRTRILEIMDCLPKCVFQGDLNNGNILLDFNRKFVGLIDYNMFGTEINVNCFLNEAMYYIELRDFEQLSGSEVYNKCLKIQTSLLKVILRNYELNSDELAIVSDYNRIIFSSFYPNVELFRYMLNEDLYVDKVIEFLHNVCLMEDYCANGLGRAEMTSDNKRFPTLSSLTESGSH